MQEEKAGRRRIRRERRESRKKKKGKIHTTSHITNNTRRVYIPPRR